MSFLKWIGSFLSQKPNAPRTFNFGITEVVIYLDAMNVRSESWFFEGEVRGFDCLSSEYVAIEWVQTSAKTGLIETAENYYLPLDKIYGIKLVTEDDIREY